MKSIILDHHTNGVRNLVFLVIFLLTLTKLTAFATALSFSGPVMISLNGFGQNQSNVLVRCRTDETDASTNTFLVFKSTSTQLDSVVNRTIMLRLLANSFQTNFPPAAILESDGLRFFVTDKTKDNFVFDVSSVFSQTNEDQVVTGSERYIHTQTGTNSTTAGGESMEITQYVTYTYDDSSKSTSDGTHTKFHFGGLLVSSYSLDFANGRVEEIMRLRGTGSGKIRGVREVFDGVVLITLSGSIDFPLTIGAVLP